MIKELKMATINKLAKEFNILMKFSG